MIRYKFNPAPVSGKATRKSVVQPDQAMPIDEIVRRFVRGIPADVVRREGVYVDQSDRDLEQVARMDFADKAALADELRVSIAASEAAMKEARSRADARAKEEAAKKAELAKKSAKAKPQPSEEDGEEA